MRAMGDLLLIFIKGVKQVFSLFYNMPIVEEALYGNKIYSPETLEETNDIHII